MEQIEIYEIIMIELGKFCFKRNSISYWYLIDAIFIVVKNDKSVIRDFKERVYPLIAKKYNTNPEKVLWNINKLLKVMYLNTDSDIIQEYFGIAYEDNPSLKAFIIYISYRVQRKIYSESPSNGKDLQYFL